MVRGMVHPMNIPQAWPFMRQAVVPIVDEILQEKEREEGPR
jgi:hypothetical protein